MGHGTSLSPLIYVAFLVSEYIDETILSIQYAELVKLIHNTLMHTYSQPVIECSFFLFEQWKHQWTKLNPYAFAQLTTKAQTNVVANMPSKCCVCNVKSSDGSPGRFLVSRVCKSACVMVFSSHVYKWSAKLENQTRADAKQRTAVLSCFWRGTQE